MIKSSVGALLGAVSVPVLVVGAGLLAGWLELGALLPVAGISAVAGAILGFLRPGWFINTLLFFLEPSVFD